MGYPTDLSDAQWEEIRRFIEPQPDQKRGPGSPPTVNFRQIVNALLYKARTGCQWRMFPNDFPPSGTIRYYFDKWTHDGRLIRIHSIVREAVREQLGREPQPSAAIVDSQTVKTTEAGGERGYDGGKKDTRTQAPYFG